MWIEAILKHTESSSWSPSKNHLKSCYLLILILIQNTQSPVDDYYPKYTEAFLLDHHHQRLETRCDWRRWWNTCIQMWVLAKKGKTGQSQRGEKVQSRKGRNFVQVAKKMLKADFTSNRRNAFDVNKLWIVNYLRTVFEKYSLMNFITNQYHLKSKAKSYQTKQRIQTKNTTYSHSK